VKPTDETLSIVSEWLTEGGISSKPVTPAGDLLEIVVPVGKANELLSTDFSVFTHVESGKTSIRTLEYSIPAVLQGHVENVHPTTSFNRPVARPKFTAIKANRAAPAVDVETVSDAVPASCNTVVTPTCLQVLGT
jgi:tripeptidyl-peptidase-1